MGAAKKFSVGGQAVMEGVMMRTPNYVSIAVRKDSGKILVKTERIESLSKKIPLFRIFFFRGMLALVETLSIGFRALLYSAKEASEEEEMTKKDMAISVIFATALALGLFIALPLYLTSLIADAGVLFNLIDGIIRLVIFLAYIIAISFLPDVKSLFQYHGAEHMAVHAYESSKKLTVKEAKKFATMHPRCGTSFLLIVMVVSILAFSVITAETAIMKFAQRILLIPVIAGISYEILKLGGKFRNNLFLTPFIFPGLALQKITTKKPAEGQIEVAIASLNAALKAEKKAQKS